MRVSLIDQLDKPTAEMKHCVKPWLLIGHREAQKHWRDLNDQLVFIGSRMSHEWLESALLLRLNEISQTYKRAYP